MASPKNPTSSTVTTTEVRELLRTAAQSLSAREEKVVRMRTGASIVKTAPLPRRGQKNEDARAELAAIEIELVQKLAARAEVAAPKKGSTSPVAATRTKEKDKIVRALRRLK
jgi:hypothetical protein